MKSFKELHEETLEEKEFPKLKQRKDISSKTKSGKDKSTPKKNYSGLSPSTAQKREDHWKKQRKKHHSDSSAYEPAPGDEGAKTKPSKYTTAYHKKYGDPSKEKKKVNEDAEGVNIPSDASKQLERVAKSYNVEVSEVVKLYRKLYERYRIMMRTGKNASGPSEKESNILHGSTMSALKKALEKKDVDINSEMKRRRTGGQERPVREPQDDRFAEMKRRQMESTESSIKERVLNEYYENVFEINPVELYGEYLEESIQELTLFEGNVDKALQNKASKSGVSLSTLKTVCNRGRAAWRGSHRPGTTPDQWCLARANAYITKGKAYHTADADLHGGKKKDSKSSSTKKKSSSSSKSKSSSSSKSKSSSSSKRSMKSMFKR